MTSDKDIYDAHITEDDFSGVSLKSLKLSSTIGFCACLAILGVLLFVESPGWFLGLFIALFAIIGIAGLAGLNEGAAKLFDQRIEETADEWEKSKSQQARAMSYVALQAIMLSGFLFTAFLDFFKIDLKIDLGEVLIIGFMITVFLSRGALAWIIDPLDSKDENTSLVEIVRRRQWKRSFGYVFFGIFFVVIGAFFLIKFL